MSVQGDTQPIFDPASIAPRGGGLSKLVRRNPVVLKELRGRMRGARAFVVLSIYVFLMSAFTLVLYMIYAASSQVTLNTSGGVIGKLIFGGVLAVELFLVTFVAPSFTAGAISGERERQTYHLLRTTLLPARRLIWGKLTSALAYILLLLLVAVPLQSLAFLMGGVTISEVLLSVELLVVTAVGYGAVGLYFSAATKRTLNASVLTYAIALLLTVALPLLTLVFSSFVSILTLGITTISHPVLEAMLIYGVNLLVSTNPVASAVMTESALLQHNTVFIYTTVLSDGTAIPVISPWIIYTALSIIVTLFAVGASVRRVRQIE